MNYKKHFLEKVIVRVDLASSELEFESGLPKAITDRALPLFPIIEPKEVLSTQFEISPRKVTPPPTTSAEKHWVLHGRDKEKTLLIAPNHFYIEVRQYSTFDQLRAEFESVLDAIARHTEDMQISRFGLRYINKIAPADTSEPMEWNGLINADLLSVFNLPRDGAEVCRAFHNLVLRSDDALLVMQYGMHNPDYPAPIRKKVFVIDLDAKYTGVQTADDVKRRVGQFHDWIERAFENAILDDLRAMMEVTDEPED